MDLYLSDNTIKELSNKEYDKSSVYAAMEYFSQHE